MSSYDALANISTPFLLQMYGADDPGAADYSLFEKAVKGFEISMGILRSRTEESIGLLYSDYPSRYIDFSTNAWGAWVAGNVLAETDSPSVEVRHGDPHNEFSILKK